MVGVYNHSREYAIAHNESEAYIQSHFQKVNCAAAISSNISKHYKNNKLSRESVDTVVASNDLSLVMYVCAVTIRRAMLDGRYSQENREWANQIPLCEDMNGFHCRLDYYRVSKVHPGLVDLFVTLMRKYYPVEPENCVLV